MIIPHRERQAVSLVRNEPTEEGRELGREIARMCDLAEVEQRKTFPDHEERCASCAFRGGTFPNGCPETVMDALKCALELRPFFCHMSPKDADGNHTHLCAGWALLTTAQKTDIVAPWPFSDEARPEPT